MDLSWLGGKTKSPEKTIELGKSLVEFIDLGDIVTLQGDLASGKTTFVKGIMSGYNYNYEVTSPTFTLINEYEADKRVVHIDCYREPNKQRWIDLGLLEYFSKSNIVIIEWAEIIQDILPNNCIKIKFDNISINERYIRII